MNLVAHFRHEGEGAGGHYAHLLDFRNVSKVRCTLTGYPLRVTLSEPGHHTVIATRGGFFDGLTPSGPIGHGEVTTLVIETDTYCDARPTGGPPGPVYRHVTVTLKDGRLNATTRGTLGLDTGCGAFATTFGMWQ